MPEDNDHKSEIRRILASNALKMFPTLHEPIMDTVGAPSASLKSGTSFSQPLQAQQLLDTEASDWPSDYYLPGLDGQLMGMVLWLTAMIYGAVHAAAWQEFFPTEAERMLWRFSSIFITAGSAAWFIINILAVRYKWASIWWDQFIAFEKPWWQYVFSLPIATVCGIAYVFARAFLVVGAVVSLRRVQPEAYETPQWSSLIPHF